MKKILSISILFLCLLGCITPMQTDHGSTSPAKSAAIIVALAQLDYNAYSGWDGRCSGCNTDRDRMIKECRAAGIERVVSLYNEQATVYAVIRQMLLATKALELSAKRGERPLLVFYYSGHGGEIYDFFKTEKNSRDQTLCLWDGQLQDNLFWDVLLKIPKGVRVLHITDTCNSGTNFKLAPPVTYPSFSNMIVGISSVDKVYRARTTRKNPDELSCDFIHFGGCADGEMSKGNVYYGGIFSYTLFETIKPNGKSYYQWFIETKAGMPKIGQNPVMTVIQSEDSIFNNGRVEDGPAMR